jgi:hypothetical protein
MTPPKAPPAPPSASEIAKGAPVHAAGPAHAAPVQTQKEQLETIVKDLRRIASAVPTPNVTDSQLHGKQLQEIATKLEKLGHG